MFDGLVEATEGRPWLWAVYILSVVIPLTLLIMCLCCGGSGKTEGNLTKENVKIIKLINFIEELYAEKKKTDAPTPDDPHSSEESEDTDVEQLPEEDAAAGDEQPPNLENEEVI